MPASFNFLQQQKRFDSFNGVYNNERPHQALSGAYPGDIYTPSTREYRPPNEPGPNPFAPDKVLTMRQESN